MTCYGILVFLLMLTAKIKASDWIIADRNDYVILAECDIQLEWKIQSQDYTTSISKIGTSDEQTNGSDRHHIYNNKTRSGYHKFFSITKTTINDAGVYRCKVDDLDTEYTDINLTVIDLKWKSKPMSSAVSIGDDIIMEWRYTTMAVLEHILVYRISLSDDKFSLGLVQWNRDYDNNMYKIEDRWPDNRMTFNLTEDNNGTTNVVFKLFNVSGNDLKYKYYIKLKYSDTCLIEKGPVILYEDVGFKWHNSLNPVKSTVNTDVDLVWNYTSMELANKIIFYQSDEVTHETNQIAVWISDGTNGGNFTTTIAEPTWLKFNKIPMDVTSGETIILRLVKAIDTDFDQIYQCEIFCGSFVSSKKGIQLTAWRPNVYSNFNETEDGIQLVWYYEYRFPVYAVIFHRYNTTAGEKTLGKWLGGKFVSRMVDGVHRLTFHLTEYNRENGTIMLSIRGTTSDDHNVEYSCQIIFTDRVSHRSRNIVLNGKATSDFKVYHVRYDTALSTGLIVGIVLPSVLFLTGLVILILVIIIVKKRKHVGGYTICSEDVYMNYIHYKVWRKNSIALLEAFERHIYVVRRKMWKRKIITYATKENIECIADKSGNKAAARELINTLSKRGEDVLLDIIGTLKSCGLKELASKLNTDLHRAGWMKEEALWLNHAVSLIDGIKVNPDGLLDKLLKKGILDTISKEEYHIHRRNSKRAGAIKLFDMLRYCGEDSLHNINQVLIDHGLKPLDNVKRNSQKLLPMKYDHYLVWISNMDDMKVAFVSNIGILTQELLANNNIGDEFKQKINETTAVGDGATRADGLMDMLCYCGHDILLDVIEVLHKCNISEMATKLQNDVAHSGRMKDEHFRVWFKNCTYIVITIQHHLMRISHALLERDILKEVHMEEIDVHRQKSILLSVIKLFEILSERGKEVLPKIINVLKSCGFDTLAHKLENDLSRYIPMNERDHRIWESNTIYLTANLKQHLPRLIHKFYQANIIDREDKDEIEKAENEDPIKGVGKLLKILPNRGKYVLLEIITVLRSCGLFDEAETLKKPISRIESMNYRHRKVWKNTRSYMLTEFRKNGISELIKELKKKNIIHEDDTDQLKGEADDIPNKLIDLLSVRGKNVLPNIIAVLKSCGHHGVVQKLESELSIVERERSNLEDEPNRENIREDRSNGDSVEMVDESTATDPLLPQVSTTIMTSPV